MGRVVSCLANGSYKKLTCLISRPGKRVVFVLLTWHIRYLNGWPDATRFVNDFSRGGPITTWPVNVLNPKPIIFMSFHIKKMGNTRNCHTYSYVSKRSISQSLPGSLFGFSCHRRRIVSLFGSSISLHALEQILRGHLKRYCSCFFFWFL